jgi:hypothetical protein
LLDETLRDAKQMAEALDGVWKHLDRLVQNARRRSRTRTLVQPIRRGAVACQ